MTEKSVAEYSAKQYEALLDAGDETIAWCSRRAEEQFANNRIEDAVKWCRLAAEIAEYSATRWLASEHLESILRGVGHSLNECQKSSLNRMPTDSPNWRWVHVLTESYRTGGHTALCTRWIQADNSSDRHDLIITNQTLDQAAPALLRVIQDRGGRVICLPPDTGLIDRAKSLQEFTNGASAVVLHVHMWDPLPTIAFASPGGPPVLFVNHADHLFWLGGSVADLVLNIRPSGEHVCLANRGKSRLFRLPLPLPESARMSGDADGAKVRTEFNIPDEAILFLTVGSSYKYEPVEGLSFTSMAEELLTRIPSARLIAIGPSATHPAWKSLCERTGGRALAIGRQDKITNYFAACDVYLEGFPFGSLTALLEAIVNGAASVVAPAICPLPFRSDDFALAELVVPADVDEYIDQAVSLANDAVYRRAHAERFQAAVREVHSSAEWIHRLCELRSAVTSVRYHSVSRLEALEPLAPGAAIYWARFAGSRGSLNPYSSGLRGAFLENLRPMIDSSLAKSIVRSRQAGLQAPSPFAAELGTRIFGLIPTNLARWIYMRV